MEDEEPAAGAANGAANELLGAVGDETAGASVPLWQSTSPGGIEDRDSPGAPRGLAAGQVHWFAPRGAPVESLLSVLTLGGAPSPASKRAAVPDA